MSQLPSRFIIERVALYLTCALTQKLSINQKHGLVWPFITNFLFRDRFPRNETHCPSAFRVFATQKDKAIQKYFISNLLTSHTASRPKQRTQNIKYFDALSSILFQWFYDFDLLLVIIPSICETFLIYNTRQTFIIYIISCKRMCDKKNLS